MRQRVLHRAGRVLGFWAVPLALLLGLAPVAVQAQQDEPPPSAAEVQALVGQLGNASFANRERATKQLIRMGGAAVDAVREGCSHSDREIRYRCERILTLIEHLDRERRIEAFLAGNDIEGTTLPGWTQFRETVGQDRPCRALFVEMLRTEWALLEQLDAAPEKTAQAMIRRCEQLYQAMQLTRGEPIAVGSVATLLLAATDPGVKVSVVISSRIYQFCTKPNVNATLQAEPDGPFRKLLGVWISDAESGPIAFQGILLAMRYDMKEGLIPAEKMLNGGQVLAEGLCSPEKLDAEIPAQGAHMHQYAVFALAKMGGKQHLPLLERFLDKKNVCSTQTVNNVKYESQLRDVALAVMIHLHGQDPRKFGFVRLRPNTQMVFNIGSASFQNDAERDAAAKKWKTFLEKQKAEPAGKEE